MEATLAEEFNRTAMAAYAEFPRELRKLVVLLVPSSDTPVFVSPAIVNQLTESTTEIKKAVKNLADGMHARNALGTAPQNYNLAGALVSVIALDCENIKSVFSDRYTKEMHSLFYLDHEIGHHILKNGRPSSIVPVQLAESACDAYAMLRHIQRFGKNTGHAGGEGERVAGFIVLNAKSCHYTTDAIQRAIQLSEERDISGLSLQETAVLADKIAEECWLDDKTLEKISGAFRPVKESCEKHIGDAGEVKKRLADEDNEAYALFCRETLVVMKKHRHDPDIFKAGKRFLSYPPLKKFMTEAAKTDHYWQEALDFIDNPQIKAHRRNPLKFMAKIFPH